MSTKKEVTPKAEQPTKKVTKKVTKKCNCAPGQCLCGKGKPAAEEKDHIVDKITMTGFEFDEDLKMTRRVKVFTLMSKLDPKTHFDEVNEAKDDFVTRALAAGWRFSDALAMEDATRDIEEQIARLAVDVEYDRKFCQNCLADRLRNIADSMRQLRKLAGQRLELRTRIDSRYVANPNNGGMPEIYPLEGELKEWDVVDGKWTHVGPSMKITPLKLTKENVIRLKEIIHEAEVAAQKE